MKNLLWKLLEKFDNNWGYSTPIQKRFKIGDKCKIRFCYEDHPVKAGDVVTIIETGRHDYLVQNSEGQKFIVFQFELYDYSIKVLLHSATKQYWAEYTVYDVVKFEVGRNHYFLQTEDGDENYFPINFSIIKQIEDNR